MTVVQVNVSAAEKEEALHEIIRCQGELIKSYSAAVERFSGAVELRHELGKAE